MRVACSHLLTLLPPSLLPAAAWFDHSHMLVGTIGAMNAPPEVEKKLTKVFRNDREFVNFSSIPDATTWMDHAKCTAADVKEPKVWCRGLQYPVGMKATDPWHYFNWDWNTTDQNMDTIPDYEGSLHYVLTKELPIFLDAGYISFWSWSFNARVLLHLWGDAHQPCHISDYYNTTLFPDWSNGRDLGGNLVKIVGNYSSAGSALHQLWDSAGGIYTQNWPVERSVLEQQAKEIQEKYPASEFIRDGVLPEDWKTPNCTQDSVQSMMEAAILDARQYVPQMYAEFASTNPTVATEGKNTGYPEYSPTPEYVAWLQDTSRSLLARAGYRLSMILKCMEPNIPTEAPSLRQRAVKRASFLARHRAAHAGDEGSFMQLREEHPEDLEAEWGTQLLSDEL